MAELHYRSIVREFLQFSDVDEIKDEFGIPNRKNLYKITEKGELVMLNNSNLKRDLKDRDRLEALSEFTLG